MVIVKVSKRSCIAVLHEYDKIKLNNFRKPIEFDFLLDKSDDSKIVYIYSKQKNKSKNPNKRL